MDKLPPEKKEEFLDSIAELIIKRVLVRVLENIPDNERAAFDEVCAAGDHEKINAFLEEKVPGYEKLAAEEIKKTKEEINQTAQMIMSK
ncbi:MAG: hypothetical protein UV40_C0006G0002 [Parcubacteria group bacterium GW2011_GWA1_42_7]|nr:MAG: hypothetical protein UV34_C0017G0021 [Parcubacteria group bacterium GW2011_GWB1_42_6]KKS70067.1 MAG: hypothetical protein UV40_C0006G0002 [Parcubacteria group bacterium GW2011_GWA1_42_7]KKS92530.1 MAG: hypothetical protein UV67_C0002G0020 [Parcubacteria group bacterium GW2011_GWC1_43_12]